MSRRALVAIALAVIGVTAPAAAQPSQQPRFLGREEIVLYGIGLKVEPAHQTVPKDIATIVSTYLQAPTLPDGLSPFAPDAEIRATLRGPSFTTPRELSIRPNTPFTVPPLTVPGTHTLENIRLVSGGEVLLRGTPEQVTIEVIERLLVTQVTARPLTAAEIREKGIVFDQSNFQAYNFSAAFAIEDRTIDLSFPVLLPRLQGAQDVQVGQAQLPQINAPPLPQLKTIIPDTLKLQTQIPNLSVIGFTLTAPSLQGNNLVVPPIPGVIVIPGDIGFLNQYFSVLLMVGNAAPEGSNLVVTDVTAEIVLPPGRDHVVGTPDDPLRMAQTAQGESQRIRIVVQPGPDGKLGTGDDIGSIGPGDSGNAEYLVEGRREGSHVVEMEISATLNGLPVGPVEVRGRAAGAVLVRNPRFTLTFTHPEVVTAGEPYTLDVTVTNTGESPANFVQLTLYPRNVSGATIVGDPMRSIESILPGDSSTVAFNLISRKTGKVTAATLDSDEKVAGRFELKTAIGELNVPLSPDSLVLPKEASSLPQDLRDAAIGLLGKAWAVATAPGAALPKDLRRFSRKIVFDRAVEVAEAGFRHTLGEPLEQSAAQLAMDFAGSNYGRLAQLVRPADLSFEQDNFLGFDELRRKSVRGDGFAKAVAALLRDDLAAQGPMSWHFAQEQQWSYRPAHISVLAASAGPLPVELEIVDAAGRRVGTLGADGKILKEIAFSDLLPFSNAAGAVTARMALLAAPEPGTYTIRLNRTGPADVPYTLSIVVPGAGGTLRQVVFGSISGDQRPVWTPLPDDPYLFTIELAAGGAPVAGVPAAAPLTQIVPDPAPSVISVVQQKEADQIRCDAESPGYPVGRVVAVLFSEDVSAASVQDRLKPEEITSFLPEGNRAVGVALQPGRRIAFIALRDPIGPFVPRQITIEHVKDLRDQEMAPFTGPIAITVEPTAGVVSGRVVRADGTPVPFASVRLFYLVQCPEPAEPAWVGIASKSADAEGRYTWDYVLRSMPDRVVAVDPDTEEFRSVPFNIQRDGQRLNVDVVFLGRGSFRGTARSEAGALLPGTTIRATSLTDNSQYGATTDANGRFGIARIPVGNVFVEAVNVQQKAQFAFSELIPFAGAVVERDITLLDVEQRQITVKHGLVKGRVLRTDGITPAPSVPVFLWYTHLSQTGVACPGVPPPGECAIAAGQTAADGSFSFPGVASGVLRVSTFDQDGLVQGEARLVLVPDGTVDLNVLLVGGLGTVTGRVLDPSGNPAAGAMVGGGLSLVTANTNGEFTLTDVPVGKREIVAVSELLRASGRVTIDLTRAGDTVNATIVLGAVGGVSGTVVHADGVTPAANAQVYVFEGTGQSVNVIGVGVTNAQGGYRIDGIRQGEYQVSSFNNDFTAGNIVPAVLKYHQQVFRADIKWRGSGGRVVGRVFDDDGQTPLRAMVSLSGDRPLIAGGRVGVAFQHVNHFAIAETDFTTGQFSLGGAWVGPVTVSAAGQFSPDPVAVAAAIPAPDTTIEVNLRLQPTSQIRGVVLQPDNVTPAGQNLIVRYKSDAFRVICTTNSITGEDECDSIPQGIQEETVVTDEFGRFWLPIVNAGSFTITVEDPATGKVGQIKGAVRAGDTAAVSVRLLGLGELTVRVRGSDTTTPIPGARVVVRQLNHPKKQVQGVADTGGVITFVGADGFSEGEFVIEATDLRNGFAGRGSARIESDGQQVAVNVYLYDAFGSVSGRVHASDGVTPVPNAEVVVSNPLGPLAFALTEVDGTYRVSLVPLGDVRVEAFEARTARRAAGTGRVDLNGQEVPINLTQAALGVVKGRVMDSTSLAPLKGWTVTLGQHSSSGISLGTLQTTSAVDGAYLFPGTARGTFNLFARHADVNGSASASGTIGSEGEVVDVPLLVKAVRPLVGTIAGVVLTPTGAPAPSMAVEICYPTCDYARVALTADGDGNFSLANVPLGRFIVNARSQTTREAGSAQGELAFDGDIASVRVVMNGMSEVRGHVERSGGARAAGVRVALVGVPNAGCTGGDCVVFTDASGEFAFVNVPARTYTVTVTDPLNTAVKGAGGGALNPGEIAQLRIVLGPAYALSGRVMLPGNRAGVGIVAELVLALDRRLYAESGVDGIFTFPAVPPGTYQLLFSDPIASGVASRSVTVSADLNLGDVLLDTYPPAVSSSTPAAAATAVLREQAIVVVFSEPIRQGTIDASNVSLTGPSGAVAATLDVSNNDTVVTLTPLAALADETRYTLRVRGVADRVGKTMAADYVATFTTVDITPVTIADASPAAGTGGAPVYAPVRIRFSETIDPSKFTGAPIVLTGPAGSVAGRTDYLLGNSVIVFTPNVPLFEDATYSVSIRRATDLAGNQQASAVSYQFTTTDRTPPQIAGLTASNGGFVVENGIARVTANVGATHDVAFVDFYINDVLSLADRSQPFELTFQANPNYGTPGSVILVSAIATDTSGNRGSPASLDLTVTPDQPPALQILAPANGLAARNGDRVVVRVRVTDDLGVERIGYRAQTGRPTDTLTRPVEPPSIDRTEEFAFYVPTGAAPGASIAIQATAADTKGQIAQGAIAITVLDSVPPTVSITGATSGARVLPGQQTTVVVTAQDIGRIAAVRFTASGLVTSTETRVVDPAQPSIVTSFSVTVPTTAQPGQTLTLGAVATDAAGNSATAASVVLPVADMVPPAITLQPQAGHFNAAPGQNVNVVATAEDGIALTRVDLVTEGAVVFTDAKQVTPPSGSASLVFSIPVPASAVPGTTITVRATAIDLSNNLSAPATITLTVVSAVTVVLPASDVIPAGETRDVSAQIGEPAPAGGLRIDFASDNVNIATATPFITVPEGQTSATFTVSALSGGSTQIRAIVQGVPRTAMTITVQGGIVTGLVRDSQLNPVPGAQLTITGGGVQLAAVTGADGRYQVDGVRGPVVDVRAIDPVTRLYGRNTGTMARTDGSVAVNVVLIPAASVKGVVFEAGGTTPASSGVRVDIFQAGGWMPLATTFTVDGGGYEFPLVTLGEYRLEAAAVSGARARATVALGQTGQASTVNLVFLGSGTVTGVVRLNGVPVPNARLTFRAWSIFGAEPVIVRDAEADGMFRITGVPIGNFSLVASDPSTGQAGSTGGEIRQHLETVTLEVILANYAGVEGRVFRSDGTTVVAGAKVTLSGAAYRQTETDADGRYRFEILRLGSYTLRASEEGTRGQAGGTVQLSTHGAMPTVDLLLLPQGRLLVTVTDAVGVPIPSALVNISATSGSFGDGIYATTQADGTILVEHVLAGSFSIVARFGPLTGTLTGTLAGGELKPVVVTLEPTASIAGTIFEADTQTPANGALVRIDGRNISMTTDATGAYRFDGLRLGQYGLLIHDQAGRLRAKSRAGDFVLTSNGQVASRDFSFVGLGTVTGRVLNPDSSSAQNQPVALRVQAPGFEQWRGASTNAGGFYTFEHVPVGGFIVTVSALAQQLYGEASGTLAQHGDTAQADIVLTSNAVALPRTTYDANRFPYDVRDNGAAEGGAAGIFAGGETVDRGAWLLDVAVGGGAFSRFAGGAIPTAEDGGRETVVRQEDLGGLSVTRKAYVPRNGYFVRRLEIFRNPTALPITMDVQVVSNLNGQIGITGTSSGDTALGVSDAANPDRWLAISRATHTGGFAFVFDGQGGASRATAATLAPVAGGQTHSQLALRWTSITVPPGGTTTLLHFGVQQFGGTAARASAERLVQLPPEALAGLSPEELAAIANFAAPIDGVSTLASLPSLTGTVTGRVFEGDGATRAGGATVRFRSAHPLFGGEFSMIATAEGVFSLTGSLNDSGSSTPVPVFDYTVTARHPQTAIVSPAANGAFAPGATTAAADVVFTGAGLIAGTVRRHTGVAVPSGNVYISGGTLGWGWLFVAVAGDATFRFSGVPAGTYQLRAVVPHAQGTGLAGVSSASVTAAGTTDLVVVLETTGGVTGTVIAAGGAPVPNVEVRLGRTDFLRVTRTDSGGSFTFTDVPLGTFGVSATEPSSQIVTTSGVTVAQDLSSTVDLRLIALGAVTAQVSYASGAPASGATASLSYPIPPNNNGFRSGTTDGAGAITFAGVPAGPFTITAYHPANSQIQSVATGTVAATGQAVSVPISLPVAGSVDVQVRYSTAASAAGATVRLAYGNVSRDATTDSTGRATFAGVPAGAFSVTAFHPVNTTARAAVSGAISSDGVTVPVTVTLPVVGNVSVQVLRGAGTPVAGSWVRLDQPGLPQIAQTSGSDGRSLFQAVPAGTFTIRALHPVNANLFGSTSGALATEGETLSLSVTLPAIGSVTGTVRMPNGTAVAGLAVSLRSSNAAMQTLYTTTNESGVYQLNGVAAGAYTVTAENLAQGVWGTASGQILVDGATVTTDVLLQTNVVALGTDLFDANGFRYDIERNGGLNDGSNDAYDGGLRLLIIQGTSGSWFTGATTGLVEEAGREVAIRQNGLLGLDVVRKIYVPASGYFARYLEILTNPGTTPVTLNVLIATNLGSDSGTRLIATSSGDTSFAPDDYWLVTDDWSDGGGDPSLAHVMGGPGAARQLSAASLSRDNLSYAWNDVTIDPGQTVVLMHFAAQHFTQAQVRAGAERLVQLAAEALAGLSPDEISRIVNFAVPPDGSSTLPELRKPGSNGTVTGRVYAGDGQTAVGGAQVTLTSDNVLFGTSRSTTAAADGIFTITGAMEDSFTVRARHTGTSVLSPVVAGAFEGGQTTATVNVTFSNTGIIRGFVRRRTGTAIAGAQINPPYYVTTAADGSFTLTGLLAGTHTVGVVVSHPQGSAERGTAAITLAAGETVNQDLVLPPTGAISGVVSAAAGAPAANVAVRLTDASGGLSRWTTSNAQGQFLFTDVPVGLTTVWAREPQSGVETSVQATVVQDQTVTADVTLIGVGTVTGRITNPDGSAAASSYVQLSGSSISRATYTDASGLYQFTGVPINMAFVVRAYPPGIWSSASAQITINGETLTVNLTLPARATVRVHVKNTSGQPLPGAYVEIQRPGQWWSGGSTNAAGYVDFASILEGTARVQSYFWPIGYEYASVLVTSADHGRTLETTLRAPRAMTIDGTVRAADGTTPLPGTYVSVMRRSDRAYLTGAYTDVNGAYNFGTFYSGTGDLIVRAENGGVFAEQDVTIPIGTTAASAHFILPVSVVRGRVTYADATPVPYPSVFAMQADASGAVRTYYSVFNDNLGNYVITGVQPGAVRVTAQDREGLFATADVTLGDVATPLTVDLQMPPTGSVTVTFVGANGAPITNEQVTLSSPRHASLLNQWTDGQGQATFPRVAVGAFALGGCQWSPWYTCASADGEVTAGGQAVAVTLRFPRTGTVIARLVDETGAPVTGGSISIKGVTRRVETGTYGLDVQGRVRFNGIPEGTIQLIGKGSLPTGFAYGTVEGNVLAGATLTIDVPLGNAVGFTANLDGTDGFRYDVQCEGRLSDGGTADRSLTDAYDSAYYLAVAGATVPCVSAARTELGGRQLVLGPVVPTGGGGEEGGNSRSVPFRVVRKIFVPAAGGFARYLELVTNVSGTTHDVAVRVRGNYGPTTSGTVVPVAPADTSNTYAIMAPATEWIAPVIGHVFAGPGAAAGLARTSIATGNDEFWYEWSISLAPGQTKALMHFAIQRPMIDGVAAAQTQAQALVAMTDPLALEGLTAEERGLIVNFAGIAGSQPLSGSVAGTVFAADGTTPIPDATVYLFDVATGRELSFARTDGNGAYALGPVYTTAQGVRAAVVAPPDSASAERLVVFATDGESQTGINFTMPVAVISGMVRQNTGDPLPTPAVMLAPVGQAGPTRMATVSRSDGTFTFIGAPVGRLVLTVIDAASGLAARATVDVPGTSAVVSADLMLPALPACEPVPADLVSWWRAGITAADAVHFGNDGTAVGGVTYTAGQIGEAFLFDGTTGRIDVPHRAELNPSSFTLEGWVQFTTLDSLTGGPAADQTVAFKRRGNTSEQAREAYSLVKIRTWQGDRFAFRIGQLDNTRIQPASTTIVQAGVFYHLAGTYDGAMARLYVNGLLEAEVQVPVLPEPGADPLVLGATGLGGAAEAPCNCAVDELKLYERALDAAEIQGAYSALLSGACLDLRMVSTVLPSAFEGQPYPGRVRAVGGAAPVTFTLVAGSPATGLTFEADGRFSGVPGAQGTYRFDVTVTDGLNAPRTATFVQACGAACFAQPPQVVSYFPADGTASDLVGSHHGSLGGTTYAPGLRGSAFQFDGIDDYVSSFTSFLQVRDTFTIEFWANPAATRLATTEATGGISGTSAQRYAVAPEYRYRYGVASVGVSVGTNGVSVFEHGPSYLPSLLVYNTPIADWTHIAVVYQNKRPSLYINGVLVRTGLVSQQNAVYASKTFGDWWGYGPYQGLLDEAAIYNRALSATEIGAIFQARGGVRCPVR